MNGFFWHRKLRFVERRTLWCPTWLGSFCIALFLATPAILWCCYGESFLSSTERQAADVLVVEGWIGRDGVQAAAKEFLRGGYRYVVTSGAMTTGERWEEGGWSFAEGAQHELIRSGVPEAQTIAATARDVERQRTFESAVAALRALRAKGIHPVAINVFTWGSHARRSRLVFAKVFEPETKVGVVSWVPSTYRASPWWQSSDRAKELLTETAGCAFEAFFNSGRSSNSPDQNRPSIPSGPAALGTKITVPDLRTVNESVVWPDKRTKKLKARTPTAKIVRTNGYSSV